MTDGNPAIQILNHIRDRMEKRETIKDLPNGIIVHAVEKSGTFGGGGKAIEGQILIEQDGQIRRATGHDLAMLNEVAPEFLKYWRLPETD